ncbi:MAG: HAD-IA family hydrolase [Gammaproteobacteria bacterium]|nr:HAD-IA family hydrolase [Gammaproteobacteria bacterium]
MRYKLLIFDWDGTLMDSGERITNCFCATAKDLGLPLPDRDQVRSYIGISLPEAWQLLYPYLDSVRIANLIVQYRVHWIYLDDTPMPLFDGVKQGLTELVAQGYWLSVATGKSRAGLDRAMAEIRLFDHFVYTRCADESRSKPHPQMVLDILDFTGLDVSQAVMIGDTTFDLEMAKNAGIDRFAVGYGYHHRSNLLPLVSDSVCHAEFDGIARDFDEVRGFFA